MAGEGRRGRRRADLRADSASRRAGTRGDRRGLLRTCPLLRCRNTASCSDDGSKLTTEQCRCPLPPPHRWIEFPRKGRARTSKSSPSPWWRRGTRATPVVIKSHFEGTNKSGAKLDADAEQVWEIRDGRSRGSRTSPTRRLGPGAGAERDRRRTKRHPPACIGPLRRRPLSDAGWRTRPSPRGKESPGLPSCDGPPDSAVERSRREGGL